MLSGEQAAKRARGEDVARDKAVTSLAVFLSHFGAVSSLAQQAIVEDGQVAVGSVSLNAALEPKATATLTKRAGTLRQYLVWYRASGRDPADAFVEQSVYAYLLYLNDVSRGRAPGRPSCRRAALQEACSALRFAPRPRRPA